MSLKVLYLFFCNLCLLLRSKTSLFVCITQNLLLQLNKADLLSSLLHSSFFRNIKHPPKCFSISLSFAACWIKAAEFEALNLKFKIKFFQGFILSSGLEKETRQYLFPPKPWAGVLFTQEISDLTRGAHSHALDCGLGLPRRCASLQRSRSWFLFTFPPVVNLQPPFLSKGTVFWSLFPDPREVSVTPLPACENLTCLLRRQEENL